MFKKFPITAVFAAALFTSTAYAQPAESGLTREQVKADLAYWKAAGGDKLAHRESGPDAFSPQYRAVVERYAESSQGVDYGAPASLTHVQVQADLQMWKGTGLDELARGEGGADISNPAYPAACGRYLRMSQGADYMPVGDLTRTQVLADLQASKLAGLHQFWIGEQTPDTASPAYRESLSRYEQLVR